MASTSGSCELVQPTMDHRIHESHLEMLQHLDYESNGIQRSLEHSIGGGRTPSKKKAAHRWFKPWDGGGTRTPMVSIVLITLTLIGHVELSNCLTAPSTLDLLGIIVVPSEQRSGERISSHHLLHHQSPPTWPNIDGAHVLAPLHSSLYNVMATSGWKELLFRATCPTTHCILLGARD